MIELYQQIIAKFSSQAQRELDVLLKYEILRMFCREKQGSQEIIYRRENAYVYKLMGHFLGTFVELRIRKSQYYLKFRFPPSIATQIVEQYTATSIILNNQHATENHIDIEINLSSSVAFEILLNLIDKSYKMHYEQLTKRDKDLLAIMNRQIITNSKIREILQFAEVKKIDEALQLLKPALRIKTTATDSWYMEDVESKFGGNPNMPSILEWPHYDGKPMSFLAQINLQEVPEFPNRHLLPQAGILYFFSAIGWQEEFPSNKYNDEGHSKILFYAGDLENLEHRSTPPNMPQTWTHYETAELQFLPELTLPDVDEWSIDPIVTELDWEEKDLVTLSEATWRLRQLYDDFYRYIPRHQLLGYPSAIQHTITSSDSRLLLQIDTDYDNVGFQWGDGGKIYFLIPYKALEKLAFEEAYAIFESY